MLRDFGLRHARRPVGVARRRARRAARRGRDRRGRTTARRARPGWPALAQGDRARMAREAARAHRAMTHSGSPESSTDGSSRSAPSRRDPWQRPSRGGPSPGCRRPYGGYVVLLGRSARAFTVHVALSPRKGSTAIRPARAFRRSRRPTRSAVRPAKSTSRRTPTMAWREEWRPARSAVPEILNICQLYERGPAVLALFFKAGSCPDVLTRMQELTSDFPRVGFAAVGRQRRCLLDGCLGSRQASALPRRRRRRRPAWSSSTRW